MQTVSRELEEEALQRESEVDKQLKELAAAAAVAERKRGDELKSKDQQIAELQACILTDTISKEKGHYSTMLSHMVHHSPCHCKRFLPELCEGFSSMTSSKRIYSVV